MTNKDDQPTQVNSNDPGVDRTQNLQEMLKNSFNQDDLIPIVRELARIAIFNHQAIMTLPEIRNGIARVHKLVLDFIQDQLETKRDRERRELEIAEVQASRARKMLGRTDEHIAVIRQENRQRTEREKQAPAQTTWVWFRDKILPWLVTGMLLIMGNALWEYIKLRINTP